MPLNKGGLVASHTRSLVMDLLGDYLRYVKSGEFRLGSFLDLLRDFGIDPASARVTLSRLRHQGWFTVRRSGRETFYQISDEMLSVLDEGRERIFTRVDAPWDGQWTQVLYQVPESARGVRESLRKRLMWMGFGQFAPSVWFSPHSVAHEVEHLRREFPQATIDVLRSTTKGLTTDAEVARRCWNLEQLAQDYRDFLASYAHLQQAGQGLGDKQALVARVSMVATARRMTFGDPRLPKGLQPPEWPGSEAFEVLRSVHSRLAPCARARVETVIGQTLREDFGEHY